MPHLLPCHKRQFGVFWGLFNTLMLIAESKTWLVSPISGTTFLPIPQLFLFHFYHIKSLKQVQHGGSCSTEGILLSTSMCLRPQQWLSQPQKLSLSQRNVLHQRECPRSLAMALWEEQERTIFVLFICKKYSIHIQVFSKSLKGNRFHSIISAQGLYFNVTTDGFTFTIKPVLLLTSSFSSKGLHWLDIIFSSKSDCCFSEGRGKTAWPEEPPRLEDTMGLTLHVGAGKGQWLRCTGRQPGSSAFHSSLSHYNSFLKTILNCMNT